MSKEKKSPSYIWAYVALVAGGVLILGGFVAIVSYLSLPIKSITDDFLSRELGSFAAIFLGWGGGGLAIYHSLKAIAKARSSKMWLPPLYLFLIPFALLLGLGV